ncbi:MAG: 2-hydroxyacyl-CoA dehydratase [Planctomycetes bacterium]|nr:2-hydroxyacyl-CoA dehydratase [Planctomycetota bacterium]
MAGNYETMWKGLGLDVPAHDALLQVLGQAYGDIYLSQENRPRGMEYYDFVMSEIHGLRIRELVEHRDRGGLVVGAFCLYVPEEIIIAAGGVSVGLCAGAEFGTEKAERYIPRNTCALIKSFFGFKLAKVCPYVEACDFVVGETTCDGKKKAYEAFAELHPTFLLEIPNRKGPEGRRLWRSEIDRLVAKLEEASGRPIEADALREGVRIVNAKRRALHRLNAARRANPAPISGRDAILINQIQFYDDPIRFTEKLNALCDEVEARAAAGEGVAPADAPRILLSGCPMAAPNWKVPAIVEKSGAVIVGEESCVGERGTRNLVDEGGRTRDEILDRIADRYIEIDCACFTPNAERVEHILEMARAYGAEGVIQYIIQFCTPYAMEAFGVERALDGAGIPQLRLETDYSQEDMAQLATRVQAFLEVLRGRRNA